MLYAILAQLDYSVKIMSPTCLWKGLLEENSCPCFCVRENWTVCEKDYEKKIVDPVSVQDRIEDVLNKLFIINSFLIFLTLQFMSNDAVPGWIPYLRNRGMDIGEL